MQNFEALELLLMSEALSWEKWYVQYLILVSTYDMSCTSDIWPYEIYCESFEIITQEAISW